MLEVHSDGGGGGGVRGLLVGSVFKADGPILGAVFG